jgi:hypothetical protein
MSRWRAFWRGFGNTLGIAQVRRHVSAPGEELEAARADLRAAIAAAAERYSSGNPGSVEVEITPCPDCGRPYSGDFHTYCPARLG